jgi:Ca-activated chloride channel homolog
MKSSTLKQILLLTDGCSNRGEDPSAVAALAYAQHITVNVIGILEEGQTEQSLSLAEVENIAKAGGGVSQLIYKQALTETVQMVTKQAMTQTIEGVVNQELKQILGKGNTLDDLPPEKRGDVLEVVEEISETANLEVLILVDTSASMHHKLPVVKEALIDLSISMNARQGQNNFAIFGFPGKREAAVKIMDWTERLENVSSVFPKLATGGVTPTGPALREALHEFSRQSLQRSTANDRISEYEEFGN